MALGGSLATDRAEPGSDIDLYVYTKKTVPLDSREGLAAAAGADMARRCEIGNTFWESGDEWIDRASGIHVDVMYRDMHWIKKHLERLLVHFEASVGYTTCLWHNVLTARPLKDKGRWYEKLQDYALQPYPAPLQQAIIAKNQPILRDTLSSYTYQIASALRRGDRVSVNHRIAAMLASYFEIVFAVNLQTHPGEKRLVEMAESLCEKRPPHLREQVNALLTAPDDGVLAALSALIDGVDDLLKAEGLL